MVVDARSTEKIHGIFPPMREKLSKNSNFRILFRFCSKNWYFFTSSGLLKKYIVVDEAPFIDRKYKCQTLRASFQCSYFNEWDVFMDFFFQKSHLKSAFLFYIGRILKQQGQSYFLTCISGISGEKQRSDALRKKKRKKFENHEIIEKSDFQTFFPILY